MNNLRVPAVPLITVDPFFSVWSCSDELGEVYTKHWTGRPSPVFLSVVIDDKEYKICAFDKDNVNRLNTLRFVQTSLKIGALSTKYTFENELAVLELDFTSPLLPECPEIMSRPVSYIAYNIIRKNGKEGNVGLKFGISAECCVDSAKEKVKFGKTDYSLYCGNAVQEPLGYSGDSVLPNWGYVHLCESDAYIMTIGQDECNEELFDENKTYSAYVEKPYLTVCKSEDNGVITLAYDEIKAIEYFGIKTDEYYRKYFGSFEEMAITAKNEYSKIKEMCTSFEEEFEKEAGSYGENYKNIVTLAFRQAIAAHKLIEDENGDMIFLSKECHSNGCIGTLDVTYPSIPMFLKYNPELVTAMLRPIIRYAHTDEWKYSFTPHDVGQYPLANGQKYGMDSEDNQMPVEECGNMLLCVAAASKFSNGDKTFFEENKDILKQWTDYLVKYGYDPGKQLCTDDFAGHLDHNCNLSVKAILGIAAYGALSGDSSYTDIAKEYAKKWQTDAKAEIGTRLTFDNADGWSLKYNMVWDNILGYGLFDEDVKKEEIALYSSKINKYGVPLDSRKDYTKIDWLMWSTCITKDKEYFDKVCESIINMINDTKDRVPLTDWYCTKTAMHYFFQNRTVVGGLFINMIA